MFEGLPIHHLPFMYQVSAQIALCIRLPIAVPDDTISYVPFGASTAHLIFILHKAVFLKITVPGYALWFYLSCSFFP
jgi:hypothetical protein